MVNLQHFNADKQEDILIKTPLQKLEQYKTACQHLFLYHK